MRRHVLASAILATLLSLPLTLAATPTAPGCAGAGPNHVALVVTHGSGSTVTRCVAFTTASITGQQLLETSGIAWSGQSFSFGEAICAIDGEPASYSQCLGKDRYWAAFVARSGGDWQLSDVGITDITLHDGDAEGFAYVPTSGSPVAPASPTGVCAAAETSAPGTAAAASGSAGAASPTSGTPVSASAASAASSTASANPTAVSSPQSAPSSGSSGLGLGLLAAAVVGCGLLGLAVLRLLAGRRTP